MKEKREKERQEKERLQKEQEEKERLEREKLEKERKEKEAKLKKRLSKKASRISIESKKKEEKENSITIQSNNDTNNNKISENDKNNSFEELLEDEAFTAKKNLYKDFISTIDWVQDIKVLKIDERDETDEEYSSRVSETIEKQKETHEKYKANKNKKEKKPIVQKPEDIPRNKVITNLPSNIIVKYLVDKEKLATTQEEKNEVYSNLSLISWLSSIFQFIIDLEITDCVTHDSIFKNIYPQKNGRPIYNPQGNYLVKLYFMGKPRKIEIDDRIPCNKDGEYIFPRCQNLCEIWPALYTKALLNLNIFKVKHPSYWQNEENVDTNFIYAMTGYHAEIIQGLNKEDQIQNLLTSSLNDDNFLNKKKYLLCLNLFKREKKDDEDVKEEFYEDIVEKYEKKKQEKNKNTLNDIIEEKINEGENESSTKFLDNHSKMDLSQNKFETTKNMRTQTKKGNTEILKSKSKQINMNVNRDLMLSSPKKRKTSHLAIINQLKSPMIKAPKIIENPKFEKNHWAKNPPTRFAKRQKTVKLNIMKITESKLNIIKNYAYSINDFFSNGNFNMDRLKPLNLDEIKRNLKQGTIVYKKCN